MNKWFPDIQLRLLDVGFRTFNVTYCTSGSRHVDVAFQKLRTYQVTQTGVVVNTTMAPQRYMITVAGQLKDTPTRGLDISQTGQLVDWTTRGCHLRLCMLSFVFLAIHYTASCPVRELPVREMSSPRVGNPRVGESASCPVTMLIWTVSVLTWWQPYTIL